MVDAGIQRRQYINWSTCQNHGAFIYPKVMQQTVFFHKKHGV